MDIFYHFESEVCSVYLVNGAFFERLTKLKSDFSDMLYVTVLPLDALYLPYTVSFGEGEAFSNCALTEVFRLRDDRFLVRLLPRFNYVYTPKKHLSRKSDPSRIKRFFDAVTAGDATLARSHLTKELSASVDDNSLFAFFDGYRDAVENNGYLPTEGDTFFLIPSDDKAADLYKVEYKNGLIDNITEAKPTDNAR